MSRRLEGGSELKGTSHPIQAVLTRCNADILSQVGQSSWMLRLSTILMFGCSCWINEDHAASTGIKETGEGQTETQEHVLYATDFDALPEDNNKDGVCPPTHQRLLPRLFMEVWVRGESMS